MAPYDGSVAPGLMSRVADTPGPDLYFHRRIESELPFLWRIVRRWHRDSADAADLVQDTVLQALANAHLWRPGSNLRGWLFTIMRNEFLAAVGKSNRANAVRDLFATVKAATTTAVSRPEARLAMRDVERALHRLPSCQQTAIRLVVLEGESYEEAANRMGVSVAAFRCHLSRARKNLKISIDGRGRVPSKSGGPRVCEDPALSPALWSTGDIVDGRGRVPGKNGGSGVWGDPPLSPALWPTGSTETYRAAFKRPLAELPV